MIEPVIAGADLQEVTQRAIEPRTSLHDRISLHEKPTS